MSRSREQALALQALGWNVVPAPVRGKLPIGRWKRWQTERLTPHLVSESFGTTERNLFVITGSVSRLAVLDCDTTAAYEYWREKLGEVLDRTARVETGAGAHYYFQLEEGQSERSRSFHQGDIHWDLRADGGGVVAPPSIHPSGRRYEWADGHGPDAIQPAPAALWEQSHGDDGGDSPRSLLIHLLRNAPQGEGSGRNVWLSQVAGHYARHLPFEDAYEYHVREAADMLSPPLPENEIAKLLRSIWTAERAKDGRAVPDHEEGGEDDWRRNLRDPAEESGWLVSGQDRILVQTRWKDDDHWKLELAPWMDADLRVLGVVEGERGRVYGVEIRLPGGERREDALPASVAADLRRLNAWLANHGASIGPPDNIWPSKMSASARLLRYLEAQDAETMVAADALGWDADSQAFICHEGLIRADGPRPFENVRPDPTIRGWAPYQYGHGDLDEARAILREVLDFHDETVAAVFGAWWAACLLKPQIAALTSQFPFMALEAASESGKTTGFFSLMLQLSGNISGQSNPTRAALRDYLSAHRSGIVWVDDLDDLNAHGELLRNVTVGGSMVKKGHENQQQVVAHLRAALVVSGEALGLDYQKALLDRAILLEVPSPIGRRSKRGDWAQWDDILDLKARHPDLSVFAGSIVQLALQHDGVIAEVKRLRRGTGRFSDKIAVLRTGARLLEAIAGVDWIVPRVDEWTDQATEAHTDSENVLTLRLLPTALRNSGWKKRPEGPDESRRMVATPVFVDDTEVVWFNPRLLAEWWERNLPSGRRADPRVESGTALMQQARAMGMGGRRGEGRRTFRFSTNEGTQVYWRVPDELSRTLLERSRGEKEDE